MLTLTTVYKETINFCQPIFQIVKLDWTVNNNWYWDYQKVLAIKFVWSNEIIYIIDNEENRKALSENMYNLI
jgi:hypothetical protein